eukprot:scaffold2455_cov212-Chaetoceros_neogracile.AAC.19
MDLTKMKVIELREALAKRTLPTDGLKADLVNRLQARLDEEEFGMDEEIAAPKTSPSNVKESTAAPTDTAVKTANVETKIQKEVTEKESVKSIPKPHIIEETSETVIEETSDTVIEEISDTVEETAKTKEDEPKTKLAEANFDEKKKARAARFKIAVVDDHIKEDKKKGKKRNSQGGDKKQKSAVENRSGKGDKSKKQKREGQVQGQNTKEQRSKPKPSEPPLLPKDEILKRLERAKKFKTGNTKHVDELKAMLRRHRFPGN